MGKFLLFALVLIQGATTIHAQVNPMRSDVFTAPPDYNNLRTMAEWEEIQALAISWKSYPSLLKQIVAAAKPVVQVVILAANPSEVETYLLSNNNGGPALSDLENVNIVQGNTNSIWIRDYAPNSVYANEVDQLFLVDWMYNRPRPLDDIASQLLADHVGLELYATTLAPYHAMNTGGNFMTDGFGTAFASQLVLNENDGNGDYSLNYPQHSEEEIDQIHQAFMGIERYIKMPELPYDGIHHIDMHMKLLDEETLLVGEYPEGIADGPQINANIAYILSQYTSKWGTPYKIIRIPMPPDNYGHYPDNQGSYLTYTNGVFVNNRILIPTYRTEYDTTAMRIWQQSCPGYEIVGIDCDNFGSNIIAQGGAIHCITHEIGVEQPLLISHQPLTDTYETTQDYNVTAYMNHTTGISQAHLYWRESGQSSFEEEVMTTMNGWDWTGYIPAHVAGSRLEYYVVGEAQNGKIQKRPITAPDGYWSFRVLDDLLLAEELAQPMLNRLYPNPAAEITCVELNLTRPGEGRLFITDMTGREVVEIHRGKFTSGTSSYFFNASQMRAGVYTVVLLSNDRMDTLPLMVK